MVDAGRQAQVHWLRGNASEWSPRHVAFFDTETYPVEGEGSEELRLRLWVGGCVDRRPGPGGKVTVSTASGATRQSLAQWVDRLMVGKSSVRLFAHNLGFDLTVSRLPDYLHQLGWEMGQFHFAGRNVGGSMRRRSKHLTLCDSTSWLPHGLEQIGLAVGRPKLAMPDSAAPEEAWLEYCTGDVLVLAEAVLACMDWWDANRLGHWSTSGPGTGWNCARHLSPQRMFLMDPEPAGVAHDRLAVRGGRRDVTRVGEIGGGPFALVDFENAYLTVAANCLLPKGRLGWHESFDPEGVYVDGNRFGVVAECVVETDTPRYPLRTERGVFYPVGRFTTTLASPEIVWARDSGHLRSVGAGFVHDVGYPLAGWARWALDSLRPENLEVPPVAKMMVKQWGRSVPGRFAARSSTRVDRGPALWPGWHLERGTSGPDHAPAADVHIAGRHWWVTFDQEGDNTYPAVLAFVESYVRVALGRMLEELGDDLWVCCDTDGAVLDLTRARSWLSGRRWPLGKVRDPMTVAQAVCEAVTPVCWPLVPRPKMISRTLTVNGPQHYAGDTFERAAGRPGKLERGRDGELHLWKWPKVGWQMEHGSLDGFVRVEASWTSPSSAANRWVLDDGRAVPVSASISGSGDSRISDLAFTPVGVRGARLAPEQAHSLRGLY